jgi:hypothetical protein
MKNTIVIRIINCNTLPSNLEDFLCKILMILPSKNIPEYDLIKGIKNNVCLSTRVKSKFNSNDYFLIFFKSEIDLPSLHTDILTVINSTTHPEIYKELSTNPDYYIIGINHIRPLSTPEARYIYTQLNNFIEQHKAEAATFPCSHHRIHKK